jgi:hypothetical protein
LQAVVNPRSSPKARVEPHLLRLCFNTSDIVGQAAQGNLTESVLRSSEVPESRCLRYGFPRGTLSQIASSWDVEREVAKAHRYLFPDGRLGGSGQPDPKVMRCCGVIMFV